MRSARYGDRRNALVRRTMVHVATEESWISAVVAAGALVVGASVWPSWPGTGCQRPSSAVRSLSSDLGRPPPEEITVTINATITASGSLAGRCVVTESLPEGFSYVADPSKPAGYQSAGPTDVTRREGPVSLSLVVRAATARSPYKVTASDTAGPYHLWRASLRTGRQKVASTPDDRRDCQCMPR